MINIFERQDVIVVDITMLEDWCAKMLHLLGYADFDVSITLCDAEFIRDLNNRYRNKNEATDILSFPMFTDLKPGEPPVIEEGMPKDLGDLIIFPLQVLEDAKTLAVPFEQRLKKLLAHGLCHLLGYTHYTEEEHKLMAPLETKLMEV
jgi:rRNA maturation RNase YbeY